jgi:riboflavin biosynthesis pyrimidine reductase
MVLRLTIFAPSAQLLSLIWAVKWPRNWDARQMSTSASLVVGVDGSTTKAGSSSGVSSKADRSLFLTRRREFDLILIGGNTARTEPYSTTPIPVVVLSRSDISPIADNPKAHLWNLSPIQALVRGRDEFGPRILVEGGPSLMRELLEAGLIDNFFLTVTEIRGGENPIDWREMLNHFQFVERSDVDGTQFFHAHN